MLIVIEGLDGAGKSTQVSMLREHIASKTGKLEYIHFPRYNSPVYGGLISRFLRGEFGGNDSVHPCLVALLFAEDRHGAAADIRKALAGGNVVLLDRYVYSNIAYQCAKVEDGQQRQALRDWIFNTEYNEFGIPRPDLNIFLDVPIGFVEKRLAEHRIGLDRDYLGNGKGDIHETDIAFQKKVSEMYLEQCRKDPSFIRVDCRDDKGEMLPPEAIAKKLNELIDAALSAQG